MVHSHAKRESCKRGQGSINVVAVISYLYLTHTLEDLSGPKLGKEPTDVRIVIIVDVILTMKMS